MSVRLCIKLCSSSLEQATDKFDTVLELLQTGYLDPTIKKSKYVQAPKHRSPKIVYTLCSSAPKQATNKLDIVLELLEIGDEDSKIKNLNIFMHTSTESKT